MKGDSSFWYLEFRVTIVIVLCYELSLVWQVRQTRVSYEEHPLFLFFFYFGSNKRESFHLSELTSLCYAYNNLLYRVLEKILVMDTVSTFRLFYPHGRGQSTSFLRPHFFIDRHKKLQEDLPFKGVYLKVERSPVGPGETRIKDGQFVKSRYKISKKCFYENVCVIYRHPGLVGVYQNQRRRVMREAPWNLARKEGDRILLPK